MSQLARFTECLGLGLAPAPGGLVADPDSGRYALAEAVNVDVVQGRLRRRPGVTRFLDLGYHSLFSHGGRLYGGREDGLYQIPDFGPPMALRRGLTPQAPIAFAAVGDTVYFGNGHETGTIRDGASGPWGGAPYPGPDPHGRFGPPPAGHLLAHHAGRIWIAQGELVRFTEGAGFLDWVDGLAGYLPPATGRVRMLRPVAGGLLIGDDAGVTFAAGADPRTMTFARVCPSAPIPGSDAALVPGRHEAVAGRELDGLGAVFAARDGIFLGQGNGRVIRLARADLAGASRASAAVTASRYLLVLHS